VQKRLNNKKKNTKNLLVILLLILLIAFLFLLIPLRSQKSLTNQQKKPQRDTLSKSDTSRSRDTISDSNKLEQKKDTITILPEKKKLREHKKEMPKADTTRDTASTDTSALKAPDSSESNKSEKMVNTCESDTLQPWVYPDPSGGLHKKQLQVYFVANKPSTIEWKFKDETEWKRYDATPIKIISTKTLEYTATDSCGKRMELRSEYYEIQRPESVQYCPEDMEYIKIGENKFCIDRYEWPNKKDKAPLSYISKYGASDSCYSAGKRLCTADEWMFACMGPYSWKYPYGQVYEPNACSTQDTAAAISGKKPECRSFFGVYDMSGGLAEWTDTRAVENHQFYYVKGGFWESGAQSSCYEKRYSYYPQNRHNPVGFRCCKDTSIVESGRKNPD